MKYKQLILKELLEVIELWDKIPVSQHFATILRPYKDVYFWNDEQLLKKIERYRADLEKLHEEDLFNFEEED